MDLVIKDSQHPKILPDDWSLGWRLTLKNGEKYDIMWGIMSPDEQALQNIITEERADGKIFGIIDERTKNRESI